MRMSPALTVTSAMRLSEWNGTIKISNGIIFNFNSRLACILWNLYIICAASCIKFIELWYHKSHVGLCSSIHTFSKVSMWGKSSFIIWKGVTESDELIMLLDTVSNSWHIQSVMWIMAFFCSEAGKKGEGWESRTSVHCRFYRSGFKWGINKLVSQQPCTGKSVYKQYETGLMYGDITFETFTSWGRNILQEEILENTSCHLVHRHCLNVPQSSTHGR